MRDAIAALVRWQAQRRRAPTLPPYDDALLRRELALFPEWCVRARMRRRLERRASSASGTRPATCSSPARWRSRVVAVHRDYMPRNLMVAEPNPGILDFQDAVRGPISYDVASLLRDAFISWDEEQEIDWAVRYWEAARQAGAAGATRDFGEFWRALEWMGLQRHLKVLGIFCRLKHRDAKPALQRRPAALLRATRTRSAARYRDAAAAGALLEPLAGSERRFGCTF